MTVSVARRPSLNDGELVVTGDRHGAEGFEPAAVLWRVPFAGWGAEHLLVAGESCLPRRFDVLDRARGLTAASGYTDRPSLQPGEAFRLVVSEPEAP